MNSTARALIVDDEDAARESLATLFAGAGYVVDTASDGAAALAAISANPPDVVVTDLRMPGMGGMELLSILRERESRLPIFVATGYGDVAGAVLAMRAGATDFLSKPIDFPKLSVAIERALEDRAPHKQDDDFRLPSAKGELDGLPGLSGISAPMQEIYRSARQVAPSTATVLITGESGTGKGELARAIHALSLRATGPFVPVHCSALPESLLESELFGHERGAFTGADKHRVGRFERAAGGTVFLDEIGEISPLTQLKLLRVLQERTFERVGGNQVLHADVRIIAATNRDLPAAVREGRFREDLFYRLNVVRIEMPPLRARGADVLVLASEFLRTFAGDNQKAVEGFTSSARTKLMAHLWPGNVRELENAVERAVIMAEGSEVEPGDLPNFSAACAGLPVEIPGSSMAEIERYAIEATLGATEGSNARAAAILQVSLRTIQYRLRAYREHAERRVARDEGSGVGPASFASAERGGARAVEDARKPPRGRRG